MGGKKKMGVGAKTNYVENWKKMLMEKGMLSIAMKSFGSQVISFLGQSGSSSSTSGQSSLCSVMCSVIVDYTSLIEVPSLRSNLQASLWNSGKEEDSVVHHLLQNHIISQGRRRDYNLGAALKRATYYVHLGELHLALSTCHLHTFFQVPKKHWGRHSFKQETGEATGFYPVCSATGWCVMA